MRGKTRNGWILLLLISVGAVLGSAIGYFLGGILPIVSQVFPIGMKTPLELDFKIFELSFRFLFNINIASIVGIILSVFIFRKL